MFPVVYEFEADPAHIVFSSFFLLAITVVILFAIRAGWQATRSAQRGHAGGIRWHEDFEALPEERRNCRFDPDGSLAYGACDRGFDCSDCPRHAQLSPTLSPAECTIYVHGLPVHPDRGYHRGHTWAQPQEDGTALVGLDPLARRAFPRQDAVRPATPGRMLYEGDAVFEDPDGGLRVLTPVTGEVLEVTGNGANTIVRLKPVPGEHEPVLLRGPQAAGWLESELQWLIRRAVDTPTGCSTLADGGEVVTCLPDALPYADWQGLREELFLDT